MIFRLSGVDLLPFFKLFLSWDFPPAKTTVDPWLVPGSSVEVDQMRRFRLFFFTEQPHRFSMIYQDTWYSLRTRSTWCCQINKKWRFENNVDLFFTHSGRPSGSRSLAEISKWEGGQPELGAGGGWLPFSKATTQTGCIATVSQGKCPFSVVD